MKFCYHISPDQDPKEHGGYVPSVVFEDEGGHYPVKHNDGALPWVWGRTIEEAEKICAYYNKEKLNLSKEEAQEIVNSSIKLSIVGGLL